MTVEIAFLRLAIALYLGGTIAALVGIAVRQDLPRTLLRGSSGPGSRRTPSRSSAVRGTRATSRSRPSTRRSRSSA
jgi:hypothetical protein